MSGLWVMGGVVMGVRGAGWGAVWWGFVRGVRVWVALGGLVAAVVVAVGAGSAQGSVGAGVPGSGRGGGVDPLVGSWYAQVHFPGFPFPGRTEATVMTFTPGGGLVEANPINESPAGNSGFWKRNRDGSYRLRLLNLTWDPATSGTRQVLDVDIDLVRTDADHFHSIRASAMVYVFDSQSGVRVGDPVQVPDVTVTTAERLSVWKVPERFPAEP